MFRVASRQKMVMGACRPTMVLAALGTVLGHIALVSILVYSDKIHTRLSIQYSFISSNVLLAGMSNDCFRDLYGETHEVNGDIWHARSGL